MRLHISVVLLLFLLLVINVALKRRSPNQIWFVEFREDANRSGEQRNMLDVLRARGRS